MGESSPELLEVLHDQVRSCELCKLCKTRTNAVPGAGPVPAALMLVGEAPGRNEDMQGEPFIGAAGKLLDQLLISIGLDRNQIYITNIVKCRPPQNRDPEGDEVAACAPYLDQQLALIKPKVVVLLGRHATARLLPGLGSISTIQGKAYEFREILWIPVYHPAAALYNRALSKDLFESFKTIRKALDQRISKV